MNVLLADWEVNGSSKRCYAVLLHFLAAKRRSSVFTRGHKRVAVGGLFICQGSGCSNFNVCSRPQKGGLLAASHVISLELYELDQPRVGSETKS
jgi:hypothetical protein